MSVIEVENRLGISFCERIPLVIEKGLGAMVWDDRGKQYLDFTSGWGVTCLGHSHHIIIDALMNQANSVMQSPNAGFTYSPARAKALEELSKVLPGNLTHSYFVNSGAEANDAAIKLARKISGKAKVISTLSSFHGRTFNTLSVSTGVEIGRRYLPEPRDTSFVEYGNIEAMESAIDSSTAAIILEPIQGEGGVNIAGDHYLSNVANLCQSYGVFLIIDEIQTGFCRTGKFFAIEHSHEAVIADFMTMGKGLAGGFPIAAFAVSQRVNDLLEKGDHGGTYCGNPLGCAVAAAVTGYLREQQIDLEVAAKGEMLSAELADLTAQYPELILEVRGRGMLWALQMQNQLAVQRLTDLTMKMGLLVVPTRNSVVRLIPSLLTSTAELRRGLGILRNALAIC